MAMDWDDVVKKPAKGIAIGESLDTLSIAELEARIESLKTEITRIEAEIATKRRHEAAASALFKR